MPEMWKNMARMGSTGYLPELWRQAGRGQRGEKPINMDELLAEFNNYKKVQKLESILLIDDEKAVQHTFN